MRKSGLVREFRVDDTWYLAKSKTEALQLHKEAVRDALIARDYVPLILKGKRIILCYAFQGGYGYGVVEDEDVARVRSLAIHPNRTSCEDAARMHMAQDEMDERWIRKENTADLAEFRHWKRWQDAYAGARAAGMDDEGARTFADRGRA